jgi:predicted PolB exonuclease-like 3'-5' exonuclease
MKNQIKRLFWDIETSPCVVLAFRTGYQVDINYEGMVEERKVICIGYKWEHENKVHVIRWDKDRDDRSMLAQFMEVANEADELVAHFGNAFDLPWLRTRVLFHRLDPLPIYKTVDTKALASKYFYFNSNKLDYISKFLGEGGKLKTDFEMWRAITLENDQVALNKMCKYCAVDVLKLEKVYKRFEPYVRPRTHAGVLAHKDKWTCSKCASEDVHHDKRRVSAQGTVSHQMKCNSCGSYHTINAKTYEQFIEAKAKHK